MKKKFGTIIILVALFAAVVGCGGGDPDSTPDPLIVQDDCDINTNLEVAHIGNGSSAKYGSSYWSCNDGAGVYDVSFYFDQTGYNTANGAITWEITGCNELTVTHSEGTYVMSDVLGSYTQGNIDYTKAFTGSCDFKLGAMIHDDFDDGYAVYKNYSLYMGEYNLENGADSCSNGFFVGNIPSKINIDSIEEDSLIVSESSGSANEWVTRTDYPHFGDGDILKYWYETADYICVYGISSLPSGGYFDDYIFMGCSKQDLSGSCIAVYANYDGVTTTSSNVKNINSENSLSEQKLKIQEIAKDLIKNR